MTVFDALDARILLSLDRGARIPVVDVAAEVGAARRTVQYRLTRYEQERLLRPHSDRVPVQSLGYRVEADVSAEVSQSQLAVAVEALRDIPEVLQASATTGEWDLTCRVAALDNDDLYRIVQEILGCPGVLRTSTSVLMRDLIAYRTSGLLLRHTESSEADAVDASD